MIQIHAREINGSPAYRLWDDEADAYTGPPMSHTRALGMVRVKMHAHPEQWGMLPAYLKHVAEESDRAMRRAFIHAVQNGWIHAPWWGEEGET